MPEVFEDKLRAALDYYNANLSHLGAETVSYDEIKSLGELSC